MQKKDAPDFICIGAPKAGTTWLFDNLKRHPEIWLPPHKSFQFFSGLAYEVRRKKLKRLGLWKALFGSGIKYFFWNLNYFFSRRIDVHWYRSMYNIVRGKIAGEISPSYTILTHSQIKNIIDINPDIKIIFLMRNPIERLWSHAMLNLVKNQKFNPQEITDDKYISHFQIDGQQSRTDYIGILEKWENIIPQDNFFVGFFDDISLKPDSLLKEICDFLDVDFSLEYFKESYKRNIFKGPHEKIPKGVLKFLCDQQRNQITSLHKRFKNEHTQRWFEYLNDAS